MIDINVLRNNPEVLTADLEKRKDNEKLDWIEIVRAKDSEWRSTKSSVDELRKKRNDLSKQVSELKRDGKDAAKVIKQVKDIPNKITELETKADAIHEEVKAYLMRWPNVLHDTVPFGEGEDDNKTVKEIGKQITHKFEAKSHPDFLLDLDMADFERAAKISGSRFYFLKGDLVLMEYALMHLAMDILSEKGYTIVEPPYMIRREPYEGVTDLSDFEDVMYKIDGEDLYLIATSEHAIGAMHMDEIMMTDGLPLKYAGVSACFRKEAGAHGKDTKGIFRVHQFNKIEQFIFCKPEESWNYHEELISNIEEFFKKLEMPYRVVNVCTGDIGTVAAKKYDLDVWMAVQGTYREAGSCSNCTDYQARRLNVRYRTPDGNKFVHTLNSTMVATTRALVAILENNQTEDGRVKIPKALVSYMGGKKFLEKK